MISGLWNFMLPCILLQNNLKISKIMKTTTVDKFKRFIALGTATVTVFFMQLNVACSQVGEKTDKTLSPYFFIKSDNPEIDQLPLKSTSADVNIAGVIADVTITQVYKNEGQSVLEAIYVFPASTRAAVYDMKMKIGEREIFAIIQEKEKARRTYEQARNEGKSASLLEQERPNVFQMSVANIMPGDIIQVELKYTEFLVPELSVYEFVYPTVAGPRYSNQSEESAPGDTWISNPYLNEGVKPTYSFNINVHIASGLPISDVRSPSHEVDISFDNMTMADIRLKNTGQFEGNRDFILQYRLSGNKIESGVMLYEGQDENFFMAMIQPPKNIISSEMPPREYVFIVDVSGSMYGFPLDISKELLRNLITNLRNQDRFNVLLFAGSSSVLFERSMPANAGNINKAIQHIDNQGGGGGTELLPALRRALELEGTEDYSRTFIIATDGYVSVEKEAFDLIRDNLGKANFFAFGIGSSVNRYIIEGMAHVGMGEPFIITNPEQAGQNAEKFRKYISSPVLTNIKIKYPGFDVYDVEPRNIPDVLAERPIVVIGKYKGKASGNIELYGNTGKDNYNNSINLSSSKPSGSNSALKYLWARQRIIYLDDYNNMGNTGELADEITKLGLKYNLLTSYTSFVAVDSEIRNAGGNVTRIKQPLPLPEGVSNYAVGSAPKSALRYSGYTAGCKKVAYENFADAADYTPNVTLEETEHDILFIAEKMPEYTGGMEAFKKYIYDNISYPAELKDKQITGMIFVKFTVNPDGSLTDIKILKGLNTLLDNEVIRIIKQAPKWKPGLQNGTPVKVSLTIALEFK
jgi:Ca-activated chloride channel family protein